MVTGISKHWLSWSASAYRAIHTPLQIDADHGYLTSGEQN